MARRVAGNIRKLFWFILMQRRNYVTILSVLFMTLPDARAFQVGVYMAVGAVTSFLFEIPSGYFADRLGHKRSLVIAKVLMLCSTFTFIVSHAVVGYVLGSVLMSLSVALTSGTQSAFLHNTLIVLGKERSFVKVSSRLLGDASLVSAGLIIALPFLTVYGLVVPLLVNFLFDIAGLFVAVSLVSPPQRYAHERLSWTNMRNSLQGLFAPGFWPFAVFTGVIVGSLMAESPFRSLFLESIGFPVVLLGLVMGVSRLVWFIIGRYAHVLDDKIGVQRLLVWELFFFPAVLVLAGLIRQPYVAGGLIALMIGYRWGREQVMTGYALSFVKNDRLKATALSIREQVAKAVQVVVALVLGVIMMPVFSRGYVLFGSGLFVALLVAGGWMWISSLRSQPARA